MADAGLGLVKTALGLLSNAQGGSAAIMAFRKPPNSFRFEGAFGLQHTPSHHKQAAKEACLSFGITMRQHHDRNCPNALST